MPFHEKDLSEAGAVHKKMVKPVTRKVPTRGRQAYGKTKKKRQNWDLRIDVTRLLSQFRAEIKGPRACEGKRTVALRKVR